MKVAALMYHDVIAPDGVRGGFAGAGPAVYAVATAEFERQMDGIGKAVIAAPLRADTSPPGEMGDGAWMLTFDDGGSSAAAAGAELARRGWTAHFFIVTDMVGQPGFLDWDGIRALAGQGHVVGSHSCSHPARMADCSLARLREEWSRSVELLSEALEAPVTTASVPGGHYSDSVGRAAAAAGIGVLFTSEPRRSITRIDGCALVGRFAVRDSTPTSQVVGAAAGAPTPWLRQRASWGARGFVKRATGRHYEHLRQVVLAHR